MKNTTPLTVLPIIIAIYLGLTFLTWNRISDDTYLYLRLADNISHGHGIVFNHGDQPVEACNSLLWLAIIRFLLLIPFPAISTIKLTCTGLGLLTILGTYRLARPVTDGRDTALFPPFLLSLSVPFILSAGSGIETALYACMLVWTAALLCLGEKRSKLWFVPASLTMLCRPEAIFVLLSVLPFAGIARKRLRESITPAVILFFLFTVLTIFRGFIFQDLVPASWYLTTNHTILQNLDRIRFFLFESRLIFFLIPTLIALFHPAFRTRCLSFLGFALALTASGVCHTETGSFETYLAPALPFIFILVIGSLDVWKPILGKASGLLAGCVAIALAGFMIGPSAIPDSGRLSPNPFHENIRLCADSPENFTDAIWVKVKKPDTRTLIDDAAISSRTPVIGFSPSALMGKFIQINYPKNTAVVSDQMGQTPHYAGNDKHFTDLRGVADKSVGAYRFNLKAQSNPVFRIFAYARNRIISAVFPQKEEVSTKEALFNHIFKYHPGLVLFRAPKKNSEPDRLLTQITSDPRFSEQYVLKYRMADSVLVYERRGKELPVVGVPDGLSFQRINQVTDI